MIPDLVLDLGISDYLAVDEPEYVLPGDEAGDDGLYRSGAAGDGSATGDDMGSLLREVSRKLDKLDALIDAYGREKIAVPVDTLTDAMARNYRLARLGGSEPW